MPRTPEYEDDVVNAFRSKRLVFRALEDDDEDMACLHQYANDPVISLMGTNRLFKPQDEQQTQMVLWPSPDTLLMVLICLSPEEQELQKAGSTDGSNLARAQNPRPIGIMQLYDHAREKAHNRSAKLAISVFTGFRGRGYGSEAINWVLDWAFRRANMHRIGLQVHEWNPTALALCRKLGFVDEVRERECNFYVGRYWDMFTLGMLVHEWETLRGLKPVAK